MDLDLAAVDMGNYLLKAIFESNGKEERLEIPNVIAEIGQSRDAVKMESEPLDGLHVEVSSPALAKGKGCFAIGNLAAKYPNNDELKADSEKGKSDQPIILLLTALAVNAVKTGIDINGVIDATYNLSTGLPINEAKKKGSRKALKEKLMGSEHIVTFLDTPEYSGKMVRIKFADVIVSSEGQAATIELTTNVDGSLKNSELTRMTYMVHDIGGLSTDTAVIEPNGEVDNINSDGVKEGVSIYLDKIIKEVREKYNYTFRSRKELEEIIISDSDSIRGHIIVKGNRTSIQDIIDKHLSVIASKEYKLLHDVWNNVSAIQKAFVIGGGAVTLKRYISDINKETHKYPLEFFPANESVWMIVQSYMKILKFYLAQKQKQSV